MRCCAALIVSFLLTSDVLTAAPFDVVDRESGRISDPDRQTWESLIGQAAALGLPTAFLKAIPPAFVHFEFEDLHAYAAEYHPHEHRMVLNRSLSFNGAGATLQPLRRMTHKELEILFHELFHAYIDLLNSEEKAATAGIGGETLIRFAKDQQRCRYQDVMITPVVQRKTETEQRFLSEQESWEALNETWAVFVGWAVWTQLEIQSKRPAGKRAGVSEAWLQRLKKSDKDGDLRGYYEPESPEERTVARKRYLAPESRLAPEEIGMLMVHALGLPIELAKRSVEAVQHNGLSIRSVGDCKKEPSPS